MSDERIYDRIFKLYTRDEELREWEEKPIREFIDYLYEQKRIKSYEGEEEAGDSALILGEIRNLREELAKDKEREIIENWVNSCIAGNPTHLDLLDRLISDYEEKKALAYEDKIEDYEAKREEREEPEYVASEIDSDISPPFLIWSKEPFEGADFVQDGVYYKLILGE